MWGGLTPSRLMAKPGHNHDAYELALKALNRKERTEAELAEWLRERGVADAAAAEVVAHLIEEGAIDDESFSLRYAEDKRELAGWGPKRIREALDARGVPEGVIEAAVGRESPQDVLNRAIGVLQRTGSEVDDDESRQRALGLLARRGFPLETAYEAVRALERKR
jgi:regulatory protein